MDLSTLTPGQIDTELARIWEAEQTAAQRAADYARYAERERLTYRKTELEAKAAEARQAAAAARAEARPYEAEFTRRGGWSRFFIVQNTGGHVHSSMRCFTCFTDTRFGWLPTLSGATEAEMVAEYGETACTVCFPSAPTMRGFGDGTSALARYSAAERAERQADKDRKAAEKAAKAITDIDGSPLRDGSGWVLRTKVAARNELAREAGNVVYYGASPERQATIARLSAALEAAGIATAEVIERATRKAQKELAAQ